MSAESAVLDPPVRDESASAGHEIGEPEELQERAELVIEAGGQVSLKVGGRNPDESTIVFRGGEVTVEGQFEKGSRLRFEIEGVVSEVTFTDLMDHKTGEVTGTKRKHVLKLDGIQKVEG